MDGIIIGLILLVIYMLPSIVGFNKKNINAIIIFNLFLGWTIIGWILALVWAAMKDE